MAVLATIRDGLKTRLQTITALASRSWDVWPNGQINCPAAIVMPKAFGHKEAMGGKRVRTFEITLLASSLDTGDWQRAQDALDAYLDDTGDSSVIAALEGDKTLRGAAVTLDVSWGDYGAIVVNEIEYLGAKFEITVWD